MNDTCTKEFAFLRSLFSPDALPLSFTYGEKHYTQLPADFKKTSVFTDSRIRRREYSGMIDTLQVRVEYLSYQDIAAAEWTVWFTNTGSTPSPILCDVNALDITISQNCLSTLNGDYCSADGFSAIRKTFCPGDKMIFAPEDGRPTGHAWPYQRWMDENGGFNLAVGWPGQWQICAEGIGEGVHLTAGQQSLALSLQPGETIRTPRITLQTFCGNEQRGINRWRRFYFDHMMPSIAGSPARPFTIITENGGGEEFTLATEELELAALANTAKMPFMPDLLWIDAGWYPCKDPDGVKHWMNTGTWKPDPDNFPNGFAPIGKACRDRDMGFLVWFEPERAAADSELRREHPEFMLGLNQEHYDYVAAMRNEYTKLRAHSDDADFPAKMSALEESLRPWGGITLDHWRENRLLNLGDPDALSWLTNRTLDIIREGDITCYRMDMNFSPLPYWRDNEDADRLGSIENHYVQGLLTFWDTLIDEIPGLFIDTCASGGRRLDSESIRRAVALHETDYGYGIAPVQQAFRDALYGWVPAFRGFMSSWDDENGDYAPDFAPLVLPERFNYENYTFHNAMCPFLSLGNPKNMIDLPEEKHAYLARMEKIWRKAAAMMFNSDYYLLTSDICRKGTGWTGYQFHQGDKGCVQVIRNIKCTQDSITVNLQALDEGSWYFENEETGESFTTTSSELTFTLPARQGAVWFYKKAD
ncbi:MAG: alpha-galactosidase [Lachnospiraceae bacterium]|nr:alpha-galactosidase [Lachnospiraceae bacterium]